MRILTSLAVALVMGTLPAVLPADEPQRVATADNGLFARLDTSGDGLVTADEIDKANERLFQRLVRLGDDNGDGKLTANELASALEPKRELKPLTTQQEYANPGAQATKVVLLLMDTEPDGVIHRSEVPEKLMRTFDAIAEQYDYNKNEAVDPIELARGGPQVMRLAARSAFTLRINVEGELKRLEKEQGDLANRFDEPPNPQQMLASPQGVKILFATLDQNGDKQIALDELPQQGPGNVERLFRFGDTNGDKILSQQEFERAAEQVSRFTGARTAGSSGETPQKTEVSERSRRMATTIVDAMVKRLDQDNDGQLSASEIEGPAAERMQRADLDGSGAIDEDEIEAMKGFLAQRIEEGGNDNLRQMFRRLGGGKP